MANKVSISQFIRGKLAADVLDPMELKKQIMPLLQDLRIENIIENNGIETVPGPTNPQEGSLYRVLIKRGESITPALIDKFKEKEKNFKSIEWTVKGLVIELAYKPEEQKPGIQGL